MSLLSQFGIGNEQQEPVRTIILGVKETGRGIEFLC